ncbi:MAG TPA: hypothetical protein VKA34_08545 [Balneolales bacterium]|nr:hypothetical protein [Balneolales bacterium]
MIKIHNTYNPLFGVKPKFIECEYFDIKIGGLFRLPGDYRKYQKLSEEGEVQGAYMIFDKHASVLSNKGNIKSERLIEKNDYRIELINK